jgi:hypothetical protein
MIKCITNLNLSELENLGDKLLNEMKNKYKNLANLDQFAGFPGLKVTKVEKAPKPWKKKAYQNSFDVYLNDVLNELKKELINWISERKNILFFN